MATWAAELPATWIPAALLAASAALVHHRATAAQLFVRGVWWSNLVLGALACVGSTDETWAGLALALGCGAALLAAGGSGLDRTEGAFQPVAFRFNLMLGLVLAMADAQALVLFGTWEVADGAPMQSPALLYGLAAIHAVAIAGLLGLRAWGLLLSAATSAAVIVCATEGVLRLPTVLAAALVGTSIAQLFLALPVFVALVRRSAPKARPTLSRVAPAVPIAFVVALMAASAWAVYIK